MSGKKLNVTHCPKGHPYSEENTFLRPANAVRGPRRECKACRLEAKRRSRVVAVRREVAEHGTR